MFVIKRVSYSNRTGIMQILTKALDDDEGVPTQDAEAQLKTMAIEVCFTMRSKTKTRDFWIPYTFDNQVWNIRYESRNDHVKQALLRNRNKFGCYRRVTAVRFQDSSGKIVRLPFGKAIE